jgi:hypothetical protein
MKRVLSWSEIILTLLLLVIPVFTFAQKPEASAFIDSNNVLIGDQVTYTYKFTFPSKAVPSLPVIADTLSKEVEVIARMKMDTVISADKKYTTLTQALHIASYDSGTFVIPPMIFSYKMPGDTTNYVVGTMPIMLYVNTVAVDTTKEFKDIKMPLGEPLTWREILPWVLLGLGVILVVFVAFYIIRKIRKKEPIISLPQKPKTPPYEIALKELENLRIDKLWQTGKNKEFHSRLTDILRTYINEQFGIDAMEMITFDLINSLKSTNVPAEEIKRLEKILTLADMVKFAKFQPLPDEHDGSLKNGVVFVENTKPQNTAEAKPTVEPNLKTDDLKSE